MQWWLQRTWVLRTTPFFKFDNQIFENTSTSCLLAWKLGGKLLTKTPEFKHLLLKLINILLFFSNGSPIIPVFFLIRCQIYMPYRISRASCITHPNIITQVCQLEGCNLYVIIFFRLLIIINFQEKYNSIQDVPRDLSPMSTQTTELVAMPCCKKIGCALPSKSLIGGILKRFKMYPSSVVMLWDSNG